MPSIKKSELDSLLLQAEQIELWRKRSEGEKQWKEYYRDQLYANAAQNRIDRRAHESVMAEAAARLTERNNTVARLLHNGINLAAELRKERDLADAMIDESLNLWHRNRQLALRTFDLQHELALQKDINRMAAEVVHIANETKVQHEKQDSNRTSDRGIAGIDGIGGISGANHTPAKRTDLPDVPLSYGELSEQPSDWSLSAYNTAWFIGLIILFGAVVAFAYIGSQHHWDVVPRLFHL